jgi:hypothetical protein
LNEIVSNNNIEFANDKNESPDDLKEDIFDVSSSENSIEEIDDTSESEKDDENSDSEINENCNEKEHFLSVEHELLKYHWSEIVSLI